MLFTLVFYIGLYSGFNAVLGLWFIGESARNVMSVFLLMPFILFMGRVLKTSVKLLLWLEKHDRMQKERLKTYATGTRFQRLQFALNIAVESKSYFRGAIISLLLLLPFLTVVLGVTLEIFPVDETYTVLALKPYPVAYPLIGLLALAGGGVWLARWLFLFYNTYQQYIKLRKE